MLEQIKQVIRDYHFDLDSRKNGIIAQNNAIQKIQHILNMEWNQGLEKFRRENDANNIREGSKLLDNEG